MSTYYLYENAAGLSLFTCDSVDETNIKTKPIQKQFDDFSTFQNICHLKAFAPFQTGDTALQNALTISQG